MMDVSSNRFGYGAMGASTPRSSAYPPSQPPPQTPEAVFQSVDASLQSVDTFLRSVDSVKSPFNVTQQGNSQQQRQVFDAHMAVIRQEGQHSQQDAVAQQGAEGLWQTGSHNTQRASIQGTLGLLSMEGQNNDNTALLRGEVEIATLGGTQNTHTVSFQKAVQTLGLEGDGNSVSLTSKGPLVSGAILGTQGANDIILNAGHGQLAVGGERNVNRIRSTHYNGTAQTVFAGTENRSIYEASGRQALLVNGKHNSVQIQSVEGKKAKGSDDVVLLTGEGNRSYVELGKGKDRIDIKIAQGAEALIEGKNGHQLVRLEGKESEWQILEKHGDTLKLRRGNQEVLLKYVEQLAFVDDIDIPSWRAENQSL